MSMLSGMKEREKKIVIAGSIIAVLIGAFHLVEWYRDARTEVTSFTDARVKVLQKQINRLADREKLQKENMLMKKELERLEKTLLHGNTPPVAAANLQSFLKVTASSLGIDVRLERALNHAETDYYLAIPVEIGFTTTVDKLKDLLLRLRKSGSLLAVSEIKTRVSNINKPEDIYTTITVTGFIKKQEIKKPGSEKGKRAA